jgi:Cache 3/Cache 2 fusion domain
MNQKRLRLGIRAQLTLIVLVAALLSTIATLYIANSAIQGYVIDQAKQREASNLKVALLVLHTEFGDNVSIDVNGQLVADSPLTANAAGLGQGNNINDFRPYPLNNDVDYVDEVHHLVGATIAVYQCTNERGDLLPENKCQRISTDIPKLSPNGQEQANTRNLSDPLSNTIFQYVSKHSDAYVLQDTVSGIPYIAAYQALYSPQHDFIGVIFVGEPLAGIQSLTTQITIQLIVIGTLITIVGIIFAFLLAQAITSTLQNAARQVNAASTKFGTIAAQQASGSSQQVWAIDAISQALRNLSETATEVAKRSEQLAQMGTQVLQRRSEISPTQIDSILNYITRSTHDISVQSRQQAATYERMNGAMQAVMEVAQQVAHDSQQTTEGAERLEQVVQQLQRMVGSKDVKQTPMMAAGKTRLSGSTEPGRETPGAPETPPASTFVAPASVVRSARPSQGVGSGSLPQWSQLSKPPSGSLPPQLPGRPSRSSSFRPPTGPQEPATRSGMLPEPPARSGMIRSSNQFGSSGDPGAYPNADTWNPQQSRNQQQENGSVPPTYPPPRRDMRRR